MQFLGSCKNKLAALAALYCSCNVVNGSTITAPVPSTTTTSTVSRNTLMPANGTCEFRTINYITHSLPQVCLRYPRSDTAVSEASFTTTREIDGFLSSVSPSPSVTVDNQAITVSSAAADKTPELDSDSGLDESSFLSFEDWKRQTLEKESLLDLGAGDRRLQAIKDDRRRSPDAIQDALKALEEDMAIEADFTAFLGDSKDTSYQKAPHDEDNQVAQTTKDMADDTNVDGRPRYRSKDAGKTCKERINFASLDAGAQVMKTNAEAKSASALLREDRDVYMLNTCQAKSMFIIVELSESILIETVAIANFEFFSSTFRQFRVSVSDRYPIKLDRWVDLGTFEARNSRDIQAFLVQDPRIWARYLRVEFLSHYGNEFYCPISLLRVHGRTMIQDVLNMDEPTRGEDDAEEDVEKVIEGNSDLVAAEETRKEEKRLTDGLKEAEAAIEDLVRTAEAITSHHIKDALNSSQLSQFKRLLEDVSTDLMTTPWNKLELTSASIFSVSDPISVCVPSDSPASQSLYQQDASATGTEAFSAQHSPKASIASATMFGALPHSTRSSMTEFKGWTEDQSIASPRSSVLATSRSISSTKASIGESSFPQQPSATGITSNATVTGIKLSSKPSVTSTSHSSQPTTQESFFKTVSKRLQLLEANSTLSLKYIEEQSRILRDAFTKVERRQLAKTTSFLENLNDTVLDELRRFGQQYDQIWQSTVVELATQRDQSRREIAAVSTRLSILADELVFQKRMSIVQSVLLLLCLGLVVFSRAPGHLDQPSLGSSRNASEAPLRGASSSSLVQKGGPPLERRSWHGARHTRHTSDESIGSLRSQSRENSPPTPYSAYSRHQEEHAKDEDGIDLRRGSRKTFTGASLPEYGALPTGGVDSNSRSWQESEIIHEDCSRDKYPDFRNSALWLATDPRAFDTGLIGSGQGGPIQDMYNDASFGAPNLSKDDEQDALVGRGRSSLPSPPPERKKPEFSIARKPLPALPREDS